MDKSEKTALRKYNPETILEAQIFELYYALGDVRNKAKLLPLARKLEKKISPDRITRMKIRLFWDERIRSRDYSQLVTMREEVSKDISGLKLQFFDAIKNTIKRQFITKVNKKGETETTFALVMKDFGDLEKAIKLMLLLAGEATDIHSIKVEVVETIIQHVVNVVSLHIKDPKILAQIALELNKGIERS